MLPIVDIYIIHISMYFSELLNYFICNTGVDGVQSTAFGVNCPLLKNIGTQMSEYLIYTFCQFACLNGTNLF